MTVPVLVAAWLLACAAYCTLGVMAARGDRPTTSTGEADHATD